MTSNLRFQEGLEVFGACFLEQRIGVIFVGDGEFEPIDHLTDTRRLLGGPVDDHRFERGRHPAGQGHGSVARSN